MPAGLSRKGQCPATWGTELAHKEGGPTSLVDGDRLQKRTNWLLLESAYAFGLSLPDVEALDRPVAELFCEPEARLL